MAIIESYDLCSLPPILTGTGQLFIASGADELDLGNFSLVDLVGEGAANRTFRGTQEIASAVGATSEYRLELTGDTFTRANLARYLNENLATDQILLRTVRDLETYQIRFRKFLPSQECAVAFFDIFFWRTYLEVPLTYTFSQDEQTVHRFVFVVVPDAITHQDDPLGRIVFSQVGT